MPELADIAGRFTASFIVAIAPLGNGLINDTFQVTTANSCFVLQRINRQVFPEPEKIMANLAVLTEHLADSDAPVLKLPALIETTGQGQFYTDPQGHVWRALSFIENTESLEVISTIAQAEQVGFALGHFHRLLCNLPIAGMHDTLPGFHIAPAYLRHYHHVLDANPKHSASCELLYCQHFIERHQQLIDVLESGKQQGYLNLRVIHGDPKLNNFLFEKNTSTVVSLIDLDTVKPGLVHYDIGDCVRSLCLKTDPVRFDLDICEAILTHYLIEARSFFNTHDYHYLYPALQLLPFELGLRFVTDYLEGNRYFKVTEPEQNLRRAVQQFQLCEHIQQQKSAIKRLLNKHARLKPW